MKQAQLVSMGRPVVAKHIEVEKRRKSRVLTKASRVKWAYMLKERGK